MNERQKKALEVLNELMYESYKKMTKEEGLTVIMTTHDVRLSELADMLVRLT